MEGCGRLPDRACSSSLRRMVTSTCGISLRSMYASVLRSPYTYLCAHGHTDTCIRMCVNAQMHMYKHTYVCTYMYVCAYIHTEHTFGAYITYVRMYYTSTYGTFHKKLNDVGRLSGGHYPTVSGRSEVGQRSVSGRSTVGHRRRVGQVNFNTYVIVT